jgi:redox-sensitive bicupin YhaK (pirin superfamily)
VTWVLDGSLVHQDSTGHHGVIYPGLAQRMSAGTGILHAEKNDAYKQPKRPSDQNRATFSKCGCAPTKAASSPVTSS